MKPNLKTFLTLMLIGAIGIVVADLFTGNPHTVSVAALTPPGRQSVVSPRIPPAPPGLAAPQLADCEAFVPPETAPAAPSVQSGNAGEIASQPAPHANGGKTIRDPIAREALSFVGADPEAEGYWLGAINNPKLPPNERQDLIEDLNEDGLSDPRHPGPQDLPLILNRLQIIEEQAPYAMDQVNADAFREAYKDLVNMVYGVPPD